MKIDEIGNWSVDKLEILKAYQAEYTKILASQTFQGGRRFSVGYIDGFAGAGVHVAKTSGKVIQGSPLNALDVHFDEYHFIDRDPERIRNLRIMTGNNPKVHFHLGNSNEILPDKIFPLFRYEDYRRALCFLDPYGMSLDWDVIAKAGAMRSIEIFLNFPIMDINRNVKHSLAKPDDEERLTKFWGDESWRSAITRQSMQGNLFGDPEYEKTSNDDLAEAFKIRLKEVAGFEFVPNPIPMKNSRGPTVYYLFFAGPNKTGSKIARHIFKNYANMV